MSALPPIADIARRQLDVRFVPKADSCIAAKTHDSMTSSAAACGDWGTGAIQRLHIDDELEAGRLLDRQVGGLSVSEDGLILGFRLAAAAAIPIGK
jgi:hypothetical protein